MNNQFKFKPDKNKYLSNVDTLDSTHKKITEEFNLKRIDVDKKTISFCSLKNICLFFCIFVKNIDQPTKVLNFIADI
jgi:hypothetical protein